MRWAYYNEHEPYAAQWLRNLIAADLIAPGWVDERSVADVDADDLAVFTQCHFFAGIGVWSYALRLAGWPDDRPIWTGSCPCQPFSGAGKRGGFADERHLWPVWFDLVRERRPGVIIGEQVASPDGLGWWDAVQDDLEGADYPCAALDLCVPGVGGPHIRQRLYWMAYANDARSQGWRERGHRPGERTAWPGSVVGGLAYADSKNQGGRGIQRPRQGDGESAGAACERSEGLRTTGRMDYATGTRCHGQVEKPESQARDETRLRVSGEGYGQDRSGPTGPLNGFWRDADWLFCRDGKWRPVEPEHVEMADGTAATMGRVCAENDFEARMQTLLGTFGEEEVQRQAGGQWRFQEEKVLQPILHGGLDGRADQGRQREEQQASIRKDGEGCLRDVRQVGHEAFSSSPGRKPSQQSSVELTDIVRLLPLSLSLAELYGRRHDARELHLLRKAILQAGGLQHTSKPMEAIWASLGEEEKSRIATGFDASAWRRVVPFPLSSGEPNRVGRLRAYGNAIVAPQATQFIKTVMEVMP